MTDPSIPVETRIGHVHLKVADLERAIGFYRDYLGFDLLFNMGSAAFLSAGGYHHHIGLNTCESRDGAVTFSRQPLDFASLLAELGEPDEAGYLAVLSEYK